MNIQSYSGSTANYSVFASILEPGDKVLSMRLDQGGHLTHGSPANWVSKIYHFEFYAMNSETELIDYDALEEMCIRDSGEGGKYHNRKNENPLPEDEVLTFALVGNQNCEMCIRDRYYCFGGGKTVKG